MSAADRPQPRTVIRPTQLSPDVTSCVVIPTGAAQPARAATAASAAAALRTDGSAAHGSVSPLNLQYTLPLPRACVAVHSVSLDAPQNFPPLSGLSTVLAPAGPAAPGPRASDVALPSPAAADLEPLLTEVLDTLEELEHRRQQSLSELQQVAIEIGLAAAQRLVWNVLDRNQFPIEAVVQDLVSRLNSPDPLEIYLHPSDLQQLEQCDARFSSPSQLADATLIPQPHMQRGTVRVEAGKFGLQTSVLGVLAEIRKQLLENLAHAQIERRRPMSDDRPLRRHPDRRAPS